MLYDSILLLAALMLATLPVVTLFGGIPMGWGRHIYQAYLLAVTFLFFGWFWVHGGQTLGMRSWRVRVVRENGAPIGWTTALRRFVVAIFSGLTAGLGFLWMLTNAKRRAWHDIASESIIVVLPKKKKY